MLSMYIYIYIYRVLIETGVVTMKKLFVQVPIWFEDAVDTLT